MPLSLLLQTKSRPATREKSFYRGIRGLHPVFPRIRRFEEFR